MAAGGKEKVVAGDEAGKKESFGHEGGRSGGGRCGNRENQQTHVHEDKTGLPPAEKKISTSGGVAQLRCEELDDAGGMSVRVALNGGTGSRSERAHEGDR